MKKSYAILLAMSFFGFALDYAAADANGLWKRPNGEIAQVYECSGKLCCKISKGAMPGFEMCHGMTQTGANSWQGGSMKHPEMPGFMTFNGTVTVSGSILNIKGCAIGQMMCDAEDWSRVR